MAPLPPLGIRSWERAFASTAWIVVVGWLAMVKPAAAKSSSCECFPTNGTALRQAVADYARNSSNGTAVSALYGYPIGEWCVDDVTDFSYAFDGVNLSEPLLGWKTSKATSMAYMFRHSTFNEPLSHFDVKNVVDFTGMFWGNLRFDQNVSGWQLSSARHLDAMFDSGNASTIADFRQDLCPWGTYARNLTNVTNMFRYTRCPQAAVDPNITASPPGPFCFECPGNRPRDVCLPVPNCTALAFNACRTCDIVSTSGCFANATKSCCTGAAVVTAPYLAAIRTLYRAEHCTPNVTCDTTRQCTDRIWASCNATASACAPLASTCYQTTSLQCCRGGNGTASYRQRVRDTYRQRFCPSPECIGARDCAAAAWDTCQSCQALSPVRSTSCFANATDDCCVVGSPTNQYRDKVRTWYEALHCPDSECDSIARCAQRISKSCNGTCAVNATSTCYANATALCCGSVKPTASYLAKVDDRYRANNCQCNPAPINPAFECANKVRTQCTANCRNLDTDCLRNVSKSCCRGPALQNATALAFARRVRQAFNAVCRRVTCPVGTTPIASCVRQVKKVCNTCKLKQNSTCVRNVVRRSAKCCHTGRTARWVQKVKKRYRKKYCKKRRFVLPIP